MINGIRFAKNVVSVKSLNFLPHHTDITPSNEEDRGSGLQPQEDSGAFTGQTFHYSYIQPFKYREDVSLFNGASVTITTINVKQFIGQAQISNKAILGSFDIMVTAKLPDLSSYNSSVGCVLRVPIRTNSDLSYTVQPYRVFQQTSMQSDNATNNPFPADPLVQLVGSGTTTGVDGETQIDLTNNEELDVTLNFNFPFGITTLLYARGLILYNI